MRKTTILNASLFILFFFFPLLWAENPILSDYNLRSWRIEDGLAQGTILCMAQTPDGYIWMGNQESLSRFDGIRFVNYNSKNTPILASSWVQSMTLSNNQQLIIGTWRGGVYILKENHFTAMHSQDVPELSRAIIFALAVTPDDTVWAGTSEGLFSIQNGKTCRYGTNDGLVADTIRSLLVDSHGVLWIGSQDQSLWSFRDNTFTRYDHEDGLKSNRIWALTADGEQGIWLGCGHILTHYNGQRFTPYPVPVSKLPNQITGIALGEDGSVWLGMQNEGLWRFRDGKFSSTTSQDGLSSNLTQSILIDREQNIWLGTNGSGANQLVRNRIRVISREEGLSAKEVWTVMESNDNSLWIGTHGGGLNRLQNGTIAAYTLKDGLSSLFITALHQSPRDGAIWVGTQDNGFMKLHEGQIQRFNLGTSLTDNATYAIAEQADGLMLIGSETGIAYWKDGKVQHRLTTQEGLSHNSVREFVKGSTEGEFWVSTDIGLNLIRDQKVIRFWTKNDGMSEDSLNGLFHDSDDHLWICTYGGGLIHFKNNVFTPITTEDGLHHDVVYGIIEDASGLMWMSSNRGIFAVRKTDLLDFITKKSKRVTCFPLGIGDGLKALECNGGRQPAVWLTRSGIACFATINGVALLDTKQFRTDEPAPAVIFEQVSVNDIPIPMASSLTIAPGKRNLDVEFSSPFFSAPDKIRLGYRLLPFDEDWHERRGLRLAHYTNIPPGKYRFELRSSNAFGIWNEEIRTLAIEFRPFFHETLLFRVLIALILMALTAVYLRYRTRYLEKSKKELEAAVYLRTKELKDAYDQMEHLSLTDTLTSLFNRRYFHNIIDREISLVVRRHSKPSNSSVYFAMGFLMIDIDHFKLINDRHGHLCGDRFLQLISKRFIETLRASDLIVRWGGEEFLVLSKENDSEGTRRLSRRLLSAIDKEPFQLEDQSISGSISIGFCPFPIVSNLPDAFSWEDTVRLADQALYRAKNSGRNCAVGIRMNPEGLTAAKVALIREDFDQAIADQLIELVYERTETDVSPA